MNLRSKGSKARKKAEARAERENAARQRETARQFYAAAQRKQLEEEAMDRKATKTAAHAEELRRHRDDSKDRIAAYHRHIDGCTLEMRECEDRIDQYRADVKSQQALISRSSNL